jgi:hypothetical protein
MIARHWSLAPVSVSRKAAVTWAPERLPARWIEESPGMRVDCGFPVTVI